MYFGTGLSYVLQQPPTAGLAKTKADIVNKRAARLDGHKPEICTLLLPNSTLSLKFGGRQTDKDYGLMRLPKNIYLTKAH